MPTSFHKQTPLLVAGASLLLEEKVLSEADEVERQASSGSRRMAPLSKGGCHDFSRDWGIVAVRRTAFRSTVFVTIPSSQLALCHLSLHKEGFGAPEVLLGFGHLIHRRSAVPLFLPKTGPFCRLRRQFPRARGNYLKEKAFARRE